MTKVGRNEPCPCGSGKKFKKCHGAPTQKVVEKHERAAGHDGYPQLEGTWGLPGIGMFMTIAKANTKNPDDPMNAASPSGSPGKYKIIFLLSRPGYNPLDENHVSFEDDLRGDSHLFIGDPKEVEAQIEAKLPDGNVTLFGTANDRGFLGRVEIENID